MPNYLFRSIVLHDAEQHLRQLADLAAADNNRRLVSTFTLAADAIADAIQAIREEA